MSAYTEQVDRLRKNFSGPMSNEEVDLLRDMQAFIEFAIRNGLSFAMAVAALSGDINEIARCGFDLGASRATGWLPKVTGYAKIGPDSVGQPEEPSDTV